MGDKKGSLGNDNISANEEKIDLGNNSDDKEIKPKKVKRTSVSPKEVSKEVNFDVAVRINNCFVEASKEEKNKLSSSWVDFMNYLMPKDRSLISLLADTTVLAASDTNVLIQSKVDSTNDLINDNIALLEKYYDEYSNNNYRFAAINSDLWNISVEKYRINMKNKIKYKYIEEELPEPEVKEEKPSNDIEDLAKDIFGEFEVE